MPESVAANRGTIDQLRERDATRIVLVAELGGQSLLSIPEDQGFLVLPPGAVDEAAPVIDAGNALIESIGHERLLSGFNPKKDTMSRGFLPEEAHRLDSPYMRLAMSENVVAPISALPRSHPDPVGDRHLVRVRAAAQDRAAERTALAPRRRRHQAGQAVDPPPGCRP